MQEESLVESLRDLTDLIKIMVPQINQIEKQVNHISKRIDSIEEIKVPEKLVPNSMVETSELKAFLDSKIVNFQSEQVLIEKAENVGEKSLFYQESSEIFVYSKFEKVKTHDYYHEVELDNKVKGFISQLGKELIFVQNGLNNGRIKEILEIEDQQNYFSGLLEIQEKYSQINFLRKKENKLARIWLSVQDIQIFNFPQKMA